MPYGLVDDKLHSHIKWRRASKGARALWTTALSWCSSFPSDGFVPSDMLRTLEGTKAEAERLVKVGLWEQEEGGWRFHEWSERNPDAASIKAKQAAESKGGRRGNHTRWHAGRGLVVEGCEFCEEEPEPSGTRSGTRRGTRVPPESSPAPAPSPTPTYSSKRDTGTPRNARATDEPEPHPQPEMGVNAILAAAGLAQHEARAFLVDLKANNTRNTTALINDLHRKGRLTARIAEWRAEADLATEAASRPKPGKRTTDDRVREGMELAARLAAEEAEAAQPNVIHFPQLTEGA